MPPRSKKKPNTTEQSVVTNPKTLPEFQPPTTTTTALVPVEPTITREQVATALANMRATTFDDEVTFIARVLELPNDGEMGKIKAYGCLEGARMIRNQRQLLYALLGEIVNAVHDAKLYNLIADAEGVLPTEERFWTDGAQIPWREIQDLLIFKKEIVPILETVDINPDEFWKASNPAAIHAARRTIRDLRKEANQSTVKTPTLDDDTKAEVRDRLTNLMGKPESEIKAMQRDERNQPTRHAVRGSLTFVQMGDKVMGRVTFDLEEADFIAFETSMAYWEYKPRINGNSIEWYNAHEMLRQQQAVVDEGGKLQTIALVQKSEPTIVDSDPLSALDDLGDYAPRPIERSTPSRSLKQSA